MIIKRLNILLICVVFFGTSYTQIDNIESNLTLEEVTQSILGAGAVIKDAQLSCDERAIGTYTSLGLPINDGIVFSTGLADEIIQLNTEVDNSFDYGTGGDFQLDALAGFSTYDACVLEIDFQLQCDELNFNYLFASEEFLPEYYDKGFNDVFAFFLTGPNPAGGSYNNTNLALIPGTNTPISVQTINPTINDQYFNNNAGNIFEFGGFTDRFNVNTPVQRCTDYTLKIAIADGTDHIFDSGVFFETNTVNCSDAIEVENESIDVGIENCRNPSVTFCRQQNIADPYDIEIELFGSAENGVDYDLIANTVTVPAGQNCFQLNFNLINDNIPEGTEEIKLRYKTGACDYYDTLTIQITDPFFINGGSNDSTCFGTPINIGITAQNNITYEWQPLADFTNNLMASPTVNDNNDLGITTVKTYTLKADSAGCIATDAIQITYFPAPTADFQVDDNCLGNTVELVNNSTSNLTTPATYYWTFGNGIADTLTNPETEYLFEGFYDIELEVTNQQGCKASTTQEIEIWGLPTVDFEVSDVCLGEPSMFTDQTQTLAGDPIASWLWTLPTDAGTQNFITENFEYQYSSIGIKNVTLIVSTQNGCIGVKEKNIFIKPIPEVNFTITNSCINKSTNFNDLSFVSIGNIVQWDWNFNGEGTSNIKNASYSFNTPGIKQIELTVESSNGCSNMQTLPVTIYENPIADFTTEKFEFCSGSCVNFTNLSSDIYGELSYNWDFDRSGLAFDKDATYCFEEEGSFNVMLEVSNIFNCKSTFELPQPIIIKERPTAGFYFDDDEINNSSAAGVTIFNSSSSDVIKWKWNIEDIFEETKLNGSPINYFFPTSGIFNTSLIVESANGCSDTTTRAINVAKNYIAFIPNAFTPGDADRLNTLFYPVLNINSSERYTMSIYNRWGDRVFHTENSEKWDGTDLRNREAKMGVYNYIIIIKDANENELDYRGSVTLIR